MNKDFLVKFEKMFTHAEDFMNENVLPMSRIDEYRWKVIVESWANRKSVFPKCSLTHTIQYVYIRYSGPFILSVSYLANSPERDESYWLTLK